MFTSTRANRNTKVELSASGHDLYFNQRLDGTDKGEILGYLNDFGAKRVFDVADYNNMSDATAVSLVNSLLKEGYVKVVNDNEMGTPDTDEGSDEEDF